MHQLLHGSKGLWQCGPPLAGRKRLQGDLGERKPQEGDEASHQVAGQGEGEVAACVGGGKEGRSITQPGRRQAPLWGQRGEEPEAR